jgi:phosphopantothenoylcysteine decarboxylase/phosphopantothenate--cysteine ligase
MRRMLDLEVRAILTRQAATLLAPRALAAACGRPVVVDGEAAPADGSIPHIELTRWADVLLVLPATANILAKAAHGIADDLVSTCIVAAPCPVVFVPAMNEVMWCKPAVQRNVTVLGRDGYRVLPPTEGMATVDGQLGVGALPDIVTVLRETADVLRHRMPPAAAATAAGRGEVSR